MQKYLVSLLAVCVSTTVFSQIKGSVKSSDGAGVSYASVSLNNSFTTTAANENGEYELNIDQPGNYKIIVQQIGFETQIKHVSVEKLPYNLDIVLKPEDSVLEELVITTPSKGFVNEIMKNASKFRKENSQKIEKYTVDFYSKGSIQVVDYPEKFLGYNIEELEPNLKLDSLRRKYVYLSETFSEISIEKPNQFKEEIKASKVSGTNQGYSFNSGLNANFDFYQSEAYPQWKLISPLSPIGSNYYDFQLMDKLDDPLTGKLIYKIKLTPKREKDQVIDGFIYIVDETWEIYAIDATVKGYRVQIPQIEDFNIKQNFIYNEKYNTWYKNHQVIDFNGKILVFKFRSQFNYIYSNLKTVENFADKTFSNQVITYEENANKKDSNFWETKRPIPLTELESDDYSENERKIAERSTRVYQDSIDKVHNKFNLFKLIQGYKYRNTYKNETYKYNGLLSTFAFNAVQGFNVTTGLSYLKENPEKETFYEFGGLVNYGIAENKPRFSGFYTQLFNRVNNSKLQITGGSTVHQFGEDYPIKKLINSLSSSWFGKNYAKFYQKDFVRSQYEIELINGIFTKADLEYANRIPLFNNTENSPFVKDKLFSSNNPKDPTDFVNPGFEQNQIVKLKLSATINFDQKYILYPNRKQNIYSSKYPVLQLNYEKGMASSISKYNYDLIGASVKYNTSLGNVGNIGMHINAGEFFNADDIAFMDYKHFYGNETFIGTTKNYLQNFNLLPYYENSTNKSFVETHIEHDFKGFIMNRIPLLNKLQWNLIIGAHALHTVDKKPYYEYSVGFENFGIGKFRPFRIDYFRSYQGGVQNDGIVIGVKFLNGML